MRFFQINAHKQFCMYSVPKVDAHLKLFACIEFHVIFALLITPLFSFYMYIYLCTAIGLLPGDSGYFTCKQNVKLVTTRFKSGGLHEKHVVATWNLGNHLSVCL